MDDVAICLEALVQSIKESEAYTNFEKAKSKIEERPELKVQIDEFRKSNFLMQNTKNDVDLFHEIDRMQKKYAEFRKDSCVNDYLLAEMSLCRMMQKLNRAILEVADFEISSFIDEMNL